MAYREDIELPEIVVEPDTGGQAGVDVGPGRVTADERTPWPARRQGVPKDIAELEVNGKLYRNWTSVRVEQRHLEWYPMFQFECTEEVPVPLTVRGAQFTPGDIVRVYLGGHLAVFGYIIERHVGYDARNHGVRLIGSGDTYDLVHSSVPFARLGNHDGKSVYQLARDVSAHLGININLFGAVDHTPYENIQVQPGETPHQVIERYAKPRNIMVGSVARGGLVLIGPHGAKTVGALWEGVHILRANCVVRDQQIFRRIDVGGQNHGSDSANGDPQNKMVASRDGTSPRNRHLVVMNDVGDTRHGVEQRANIEVAFTEGSEIEAHITVQGWFKDNNRSDDIWRAGEYYVVDSPSLILHNAVMGCKGCVYEQNNGGGTTTTLLMVKPKQMHGSAHMGAEAESFVREERRQQQQVQPDAGGSVE